MSKTSVIITTYNDAFYLKRSIPSVINQSQKPLEIIVVDDGSKDNSAEVIINECQILTDIPIIFYKKVNGGPSSARNIGIQIAKGDYILFLDADDELMKDSIEWRQQTLDKLGLTYGSVYCGAINSYDNKSKRIEQVIEIDGQIDGCMLGRKNGIPGQLTYHLFRREVLIKMNGYNESLKFNEDFELILRISKQWMFYGVDRVGFIRHIRKDSWSRSDPFIAYAGVEDFLDITIKEKLLPITEVNQRKKENRLSLVKKLILERKKWSVIHPYINDAFNINNPENLKEKILYWFNLTWKIILGKEN